jgi:hypothetical protein
MSGFTHQSRQPHHPQIASLALGVAATRQFPWCRSGDMRVKVGRVERQHIRRQLEAPNYRAGDLDLRPLQLLLRDLGGQSVKRLPGERGGRQARHAWNARFQKRSKMALARRLTGSLYRNGEHHLANRRTTPRSFQATGLINELDQIQLLSDPYQSTHVADQSRPHRMCRTQVGDRSGICRAQNGLSCERSLLGGIPQ